MNMIATVTSIFNAIPMAMKNACLASLKSREPSAVGIWDREDILVFQDAHEFWSRYQARQDAENIGKTITQLETLARNLGLKKVYDGPWTTPALLGFGAEVRRHFVGDNAA
jgi:hypothetical protein